MAGLKSTSFSLFGWYHLSKNETVSSFYNIVTIMVRLYHQKHVAWCNGKYGIWNQKTKVEILTNRVNSVIQGSLKMYWLFLIRYVIYNILLSKPYKLFCEVIILFIEEEIRSSDLWAIPVALNQKL